MTRGSIGYSSVEALHSRLVSCEGARLEYWISTIRPFLGKIFSKPTSRVDFGVAFSINFVSSSAFFTERKNGFAQICIRQMCRRYIIETEKYKSGANMVNATFA